MEMCVWRCVCVCVEVCVCVWRCVCGGEIDSRRRGRQEVARRSVPVFEIPLTAKAISWRWLCCQLLGWLAVKYGGWESAASSPPTT